MSLTKEELENSLSNLYHVSEHPCEECSHNRTEFCNQCNVKEDLSNMRKLIHEHFASEHTLNFKHFHLLADSTLKQWGKEALIDYIHTLYHNWQSSDISYKCVMDYAINLQNEIEKLKSYDTPQFTVEEIDSIQTLVDLEIQKCDRAYGKYTEGLKKLLNKLQKQKEMLQK